MSQIFLFYIEEKNFASFFFWKALFANYFSMYLLSSCFWNFWSREKESQVKAILYSSRPSSTFSSSPSTSPSSWCPPLEFQSTSLLQSSSAGKWDNSSVSSPASFSQFSVLTWTSLRVWRWGCVRSVQYQPPHLCCRLPLAHPTHLRETPLPTSSQNQRVWNIFYFDVKWIRNIIKDSGTFKKG